MGIHQMRSILFPLHRYIGLAVGLVLIIVSVTGSLLVFSHELADQLVVRRFGAIAPQETLISIDDAIESAKAELQNLPGYSLDNIRFPQRPDQPYEARLWNENELIQLFIHPYSAKVLGKFTEGENWLNITLRLHYQLMAGSFGLILVGVTGFLMVVLSITGTVLWPGWRRLVAGFKIKWNAHPKRRNFDLHKVAGIIAAVFLILTGFTGFCWNFYDQTSAVIRAVTLTPSPPTPRSRVLPNQTPLPLAQLLAASEQALPGATNIYVSLPSTPDGVVRIGKRQPQERSYYGMSSVVLDAYSGQVLQVNDSRQAALGDRILNSFAPLHFGTFAGLWSRWLYVFVGLSPIVLFWTGAVMWKYRKKPSPSPRPMANRS